MASKAQVVVTATTERSLDGEAWTPIPECNSLAVPMEELEYQDVTSLDSQGVREFAPGLINPGEITLPCNYTPDGHDQQLQDRTAARQSPIYYRTTFPLFAGQATPTTVEYRGIPNPSVETTAVGDTLKMNIAIRVSGRPTWTPGTAAA